MWNSLLKLNLKEGESLLFFEKKIIKYLMRWIFLLDYIKVINDQISVVDDHVLEVVDQPFTKYMNHLLKPSLVNLKIRERMTKQLYNFHHKIPIIVSRSVLLICYKSYRLHQAFYINYYQILYWERLKNEVIVHFKSDHCMKLDSYQIFINQLLKVKQILASQNILY